MTPTQVAQRQHPSQEGLPRLHPEISWEAEPRPGETVQEAAYRAAIDAATAILVAYDDGTAEHSDDVVTLSEAIADRLNVTGEERKHVTAVAALHDIGKVAVPPEIINKPGPLNELEWKKIRRHTIEGQEILGAVPEIAEVAALVRSCHERYDGTGYPDGLVGDQIPLVARIVFCADAFHAMRGDRPYRPGRPATEALAELKANAGTQFDPVVVAALCDVRKRLTGRHRRGVTALASGARGRRLVVLLAALAVSGSAMAATGSFKHLPLADGAHHAPGAAADPLAAVRTSVFGPAFGTPASGGAAPGAAVAGAHRAVTAKAGHKGGHGRHGKANPPGLAHGLRGTAPGQVKSGPGVPADPHGTSKGNGNQAKAPKVKKPKKAKKPKTTGQSPGVVKSPGTHKQTKVKLPKVKLPKVEIKIPKVKAPKPPKVPKAPKLKK
jgi:HD domain-containing protein